MIFPPYDLKPHTFVSLLPWLHLIVSGLISIFLAKPFPFRFLTPPFSGILTSNDPHRVTPIVSHFLQMRLVVYVNMSTLGLLILIVYLQLSTCRSCASHGYLFSRVIFLPQLISFILYPLVFPLFGLISNSVLQASSLPVIFLRLFIPKMPGHDHSLRIMFQPDSLSNSAMVLNWMCPVGDGEPDIFNTLNE